MRFHLSADRRLLNMFSAKKKKRHEETKKVECTLRFCLRWRSSGIRVVLTDGSMDRGLGDEDIALVGRGEEDRVESKGKAQGVLVHLQPSSAVMRCVWIMIEKPDPK